MNLAVCKTDSIHNGCCRCLLVHEVAVKLALGAEIWASEYIASITTRFAGRALSMAVCQRVWLHPAPASFLNIVLVIVIFIEAAILPL